MPYPILCALFFFVLVFLVERDVRRSEFNKTVNTATKTEAERSLLPFIPDVAEQLEAAARQYTPQQIEDLTEDQVIDLARAISVRREVARGEAEGVNPTKIARLKNIIENRLRPD